MPLKPRPRIVALLAALLWGLAWSCGTPHAKEVWPGTDLHKAVRDLRPGDEIVLRGGSYVLRKALVIRARGTRAAPVVLRAARGERPTLRQADGDENIVEIERSRHVVLKGLELTGGSHGVHLEASSFITIENCDIHHTGDVGIAANTAGSTYVGLRLLGNEVHHTSGSGEGMYLGCNDDECRVAHSLIAGNHVHHTNGPDVEQGDGIELKEGSFANVVRDNVVHDTNYPAIIVYGTVGNGEQNVIEGNAVWNAAPDDYAIQAAADAVIRNNVVLGSPIGMQPHQAAAPSNILVAHNTVIADDDCVIVRDPVGEVVIANNALYARNGAALRISGDARKVVVTGNAGQGETDPAGTGFRSGGDLGRDFAGARFGSWPAVDLRLKPGSLLIGAGDPAYVARADFAGTKRGKEADVGAYAWLPKARRHWPLDASFKH